MNIECDCNRVAGSGDRRLHFCTSDDTAACHAAKSADVADSERGSWWHVSGGPSGTRGDRRCDHRRGAWVGTGLVSGQVVRVWRDEATGIVFQRGGWRYLIVLIVLLLAQVLIRFVFMRSGSAVDETALNAALIAALVGNLLGRDIRTARRALLLAGGSFTNLSSR